MPPTLQENLATFAFRTLPLTLLATYAATVIVLRALLVLPIALTYNYNPIALLFQPWKTLLFGIVTLWCLLAALGAAIERKYHLRLILIAVAPQKPLKNHYFQQKWDSYHLNCLFPYTKPLLCLAWATPACLGATYQVLNTGRSLTPWTETCFVVISA